MIEGKTLFVLFMHEIYRFLTYPFEIWGFHFSIFNAYMVLQVSSIIFNSIGRMFGHMEVENDNG